MEVRGDVKKFLHFCRPNMQMVPCTKRRTRKCTDDPEPNSQDTSQTSFMDIWDKLYPPLQILDYGHLWTNEAICGTIIGPLLKGPLFGGFFWFFSSPALPHQ